MNLSKLFKESEILRPSVLLTIGTLLLLLMSSHVPSPKALGVILLSILFFLAGEQLAFKKFRTKLKLPKDKLFRLGAILFVISLAALYLDFFTAGGIPVFNAVLRRFLSPALTYMAFLMVPAVILMISGVAGKKHAKLVTLGLMFFAAGMMTLLGFRTEVLAALLASTFTAYYSGVFDFRELALLFLVALVAFTGLSIMRTGSAGFSDRSTLTVAAFDYLVEITPTYGLTHGYVEFSDIIRYLTKIPMWGGRVLVSSLIGLREGVSTTSTLYGPPFADFGVFGFALFFIFGLLLGSGYKAARTKKNIFAPAHALLLTFLLLGIETGIVDLIVWLYFLTVGILYVVAYEP